MQQFTIDGAPINISPARALENVKTRLERPGLDAAERESLERVMNSIRNGLGMRETEIAKEPSRPWNPHSYVVFAQVHNTL